MNKTERVPDAVQKLRDGKSEMRAARISMSLPEKVRQVVRLQRVALPAIRRRRALRPLERVWFEDED
jgi:hypothetical protein